jgi:GNAT superfamily N-acetyltransferase
VADPTDEARELLEVRAGRPWARGLGVTLVPAEGGSLSAGLEQAARDGIARGFEGELPSSPEGSICFLVRTAGRTVGLLALQPGVPHVETATVVGVAIDPTERGRDLATRAVIVTERRLRRLLGVRELYGQAPRGNGRGLYFWLRAGFAPARVSGVEGGDVTWFSRAITDDRG